MTHCKQVIGFERERPLWRNLLVFVLVALSFCGIPSTARGQGADTQSITLSVGGRTVSGTFYYYGNVDGNNNNVIYSTVISATSGFPGTPAWYWQVITSQTHYVANAQLVPFAVARNVVSGTTGTNAFTQSTLELLLAGIASNSAATWKTGRYVTYVQIRDNTNAVQAQTSFETTVMDYSVWDGSASGGQGSNNSDTPGFWENLFVPSEGCLQDVVDASEQYTEWGPFGFLNDLNEAMAAAELSGDTANTYAISLTGSPTTQPMEVAPGALSPALETVRVFLIVSVWVGVLLYAWKLVRNSIAK